MSADKVVIQRLPTGVPGLDSLLGGGLDSRHPSRPGSTARRRR